MPKYKMTIWLESADRGTCVIEAKDEREACEAARDIVCSGDHGVITWDRGADGDLTVEVAETVSDEVEADYDATEEDEDAEA